MAKQPELSTQEFNTLVCDAPAAHVLRVTLDRPQVANAFNTEMAGELACLFERLRADLGETRALVLTGTGDRAFCAGGDLKERNGMSDETWFAQHLVYERMVRALLGVPVPVIGAVNGAAYGGGCELAAGCDFLIAASHAKFAQTEVGLGIIPGAGGTQLLARAVGERRAKQIILTGEPFTAKEAEYWGLVNEVVTKDALMDRAVEIASRIARNAPVAVRQAKQAIRTGLDMGLAEGLAFEIEAYNRTIVTRDRREGVAAFNEKRKAKFDGR